MHLHVAGPTEPPPVPVHICNYPWRTDEQEELLALERRQLGLCYKYIERPAGKRLLFEVVDKRYAQVQLQREYG